MSTSWIATELARAGNRGASNAAEKEVLRRLWLESASVAMLSFVGEEHFPFEVESAFRVSAGLPFDIAVWEAIYDACVVAGLDQQVPWDVAGHAELRHAKVDVEAGLRQWTGPELVFIDQTQGECQCLVLAGTGWPVAKRCEETSIRGLAYVNGDNFHPVPRWLMQFDPDDAELSLFAGRENGRWLWRRAGRRKDVWSAAPPSSAPPYLNDAGVGDVPSGSYDNVHTSTVPAAARRLIAPTQAAGHGETTVLRALGGWDRERFLSLTPGNTVLIGRQGPKVGFAVHHSEVSRHHAELRCDEDGGLMLRDRSSTNGTTVAGRRVGQSWTKIQMGEVIGLGRAPLVVERVTSTQLQRLEALEQLLVPSPDRDPLTRLLLPDTQERLLAVGRVERTQALLYIERLATLHARLGQSIADLVFMGVARQVQRHAPNGLHGARVGYGEVLIPIGGMYEGRVVVEEVRSAVERSVWDADVGKVQVSAVLATRAVDESREQFLRRMRQAVQNSSGRHLPGEVIEI